MKKDNFKTNFGKNQILYIKAFLIESIVSALFLMVFAGAMLLLESGFRYAALFATLSVSIGAGAASFYLALRCKKRGWLFGVTVGGVTFLLLTLIALALNGGSLTGNTVFRFVILMLCSLIGGVLGVGKSETRKYL